MKIKPDTNNINLTRKIFGLTNEFKKKRLDVIEEKPLTLFLNDQEIVTMMTVNDYPKYLALGYLLNQNMISKRTKIESVEYEDDIQTVVHCGPDGHRSRGHASDELASALCARGYGRRIHHHIKKCRRQNFSALLFPVRKSQSHLLKTRAENCKHKRTFSAFKQIFKVREISFRILFTRARPFNLPKSH